MSWGESNWIVNKIKSAWTDTRAGYIDNIRSYTITNNTASSTGVLSSKLSYIINNLNAFHKPTKITTQNVTSSASFSGTGKGYLFISGNSNLTITIDDTSMGSVDAGSSDMFWFIEFTKSFSITSSTTTTQTCIAVFY